jgi:putative ABC transport system permease protein
LWAVLAAIATAIGAGLLFGALPARRAARLDPVRALSRH